MEGIHIIVYTFLLVKVLHIMYLLQDSVRGALGSLLSLCVCTGYLMVYCVGPFVSYNALIYCSLIAPFLFILLFPFTPESPSYLLQKGRKSEALASLTWLRKGKAPDDLEKELHMMQVLSLIHIWIHANLWAHI